MPREMTDKDRELLTTLEGYLTEAVGSVGDIKFREESLEDLQFYALQQDTPEVISKLDSLKRPATVYDEVRHKVDAIIAQVHAITEPPTIEPVNHNDRFLDELMSATLKYFRRKMDTLDVEHECGEYQIKTGLAYQYFYVDKTNPMKPQLKTCYVPASQVYLDPRSRKYDMSDARYILYEKWLSKDELEDQFPGQFNFDEMRQALQYTQSSTSGTSPIYYSSVRDVYRIVEAYYRKSIEVVYYVNPLTQKDEWVPKDDWRKLVDALVGQFQVPEESIQAIPGRKSVVHQAIFSYGMLVESGYCPYWFCKEFGYFPLVKYAAYKDDNFNIYFGAIRSLKDPQRVFNTLIRQLTHLLQTAPRGILMHELNAITNIEDYEERSADPTYHMELQSGGLSKVKFSNQPQISPIYESLIGKVKQGMKDISGVQDTMLGVQTSSREPGVTAGMRQDASLAILSILFNNFHKSRKIATRIQLALIQQYVTEPMMIRIAGPEGAQLLEINTQVNPGTEGFNDITSLEYDLAVEDYPERFKNAETMLKLLSDFGMNNPGAVPLELLLEFLPVDENVKQKMLIYRQQQMEAAAEQAKEEAKSSAAKPKPGGK